MAHNLADLQEMASWVGRQGGSQEAERLLYLVRERMVHDLCIPDGDEGLGRISQNTELTPRAERAYRELNQLLSRI